MQHYELKRGKLLDDGYLMPFIDAVLARKDRIRQAREDICRQSGSLKDFASGHLYFGLHRTGSGWVFREFAPNATAIYLVGEFSGWQELEEFSMQRISKHGVWEIELGGGVLHNSMRYYLSVYWPGGNGRRLPSYANRVVQDSRTKIFDAEVCCADEPYRWKYSPPENDKPLLIYELHIGMSQEKEAVGSYDEFTANVLPEIAALGYNTIQIMALQEHPYYGSFGYHVSNFFAASSRFGRPEELKNLVDTAHGMGLRVVMDLVHSHAVRNENEGVANFDGTNYLYFHEGGRGVHRLWDSYCFNYAKPEVRHFLLSNCRYWLEEYNVDGFRFDGITSMLYKHHGIGKAFTSYHDYFGDDVDEDAYTYLALANELIHQIKPEAVTIAEDVSGMPGLACREEGGCGFDYRMAMGVTDIWFKMTDRPDEDWDMGAIVYELFNRRSEEKTISYVECHDQALVGGKTLIFTLMDSAMYYDMHKNSRNMNVDRAISLHKMIRLATAASCSGGYLNFMGNEFGHPEWIDFPREGNGWSYKYARRQWSLAKNTDLRYNDLLNFDRAMLELLNGRDILRYRPQQLYVNDGDKVFAYERGGYFFFFNFHPVNSYSDYGITALPGEYELVFDSDRKEFGGFSRVEANQRYYTMERKRDSEVVSELMLYLPSRCSLVLKREKW